MCHSAQRLLRCSNRVESWSSRSRNDVGEEKSDYVEIYPFGNDLESYRRQGQEGTGVSRGVEVVRRGTAETKSGACG